MNWDSLQVPGEPGVWNCARHKSVQTRLRCGKCEKPICPRCTVMTSVGARCRDCASNRSSHIYQIAPAQFALAFGAAMGAGILGAILVRFLGGLWLFALLYAPALGPLLGRLVARITRGKRGYVLASVTVAGLATGAVGMAFALGVWASLVFWLMLAIAGVGAWMWIK